MRGWLTSVFGGVALVGLGCASGPGTADAPAGRGGGSGVKAGEESGAKTGANTGERVETGTRVAEDLATDAGVLVAWNRETGGRCEAVEHCLCVHRPRGLDGVVVTGAFAYDRGCRMSGVFAENTWYGDPNAATGPLLEANGWRAADPSRRMVLARAVVDDVLFAWSSPLLDTVPAGAGPSITPTVTTETPEGGVRVEGFHQTDSSGHGRQPVPSSPTYAYVVYVFGPDGVLQP